jgi:deoxyadenosine/deoxycytidine kinase
VVALPCKAHSFHPSCIEQWLKVNSVCPECRFNVAKENLAQQKKDMKKAFKEIKKIRKASKKKNSNTSLQ